MTDIMPYIYADNAATTPLSPRALEALTPQLTRSFGNPSGLHRMAREAAVALGEARGTMARLLGAEHADEIYFTSGGSESDNWILRGAVRRFRDAYGERAVPHNVTSAIEHHAILHCCQALEAEGVRVTYLPVDALGRVHPSDLERALEDDDVRELAVDALSLSAHKVHGPRGIGALDLREGFSLPPLIAGGAQERGERAGTENLAGIVGMATALEEEWEHLAAVITRISTLRDELVGQLMKHVDGIRLTGAPISAGLDGRLPSVASFTCDRRGTRHHGPPPWRRACRRDLLHQRRLGIRQLDPARSRAPLPRRIWRTCRPPHRDQRNRAPRHPALLSGP